MLSTVLGLLGTIVIFNVWYVLSYIIYLGIGLTFQRAMHRDTQHFPDCEDFRPERFLDSEGQYADIVPDTQQLGHMSFGTGRRCLFRRDKHTGN